jgi:hypothetical protein
LINQLANLRNFRFTSDPRLAVEESDLVIVAVDTFTPEKEIITMPATDVGLRIERTRSLKS